MISSKFFEAVRATLFRGHLTEGQTEGLNTLLAAWTKWFPNADVRWVAYSLATAYWETGDKLQPVREVGEGRGHAYGVPTGPWRKAYYGRGDVQLTWEANYRKATVDLQRLKILSPSQSLDKTPDLALQPDIAATVLIVGMMQGWFTGKKLIDYFSPKANDPTGARRIINGTDHAAQIGVFYEHFLEALKASQYGPGADKKTN